MPSRVFDSSNVADNVVVYLHENARMATPAHHGSSSESPLLSWPNLLLWVLGICTLATGMLYGMTHILLGLLRTFD